MQENSEIVFEKADFEKANIAFSEFRGNDTTEYNLFITPRKTSDFQEQINAIENGLQQFMRDRQIGSDAVFFERFFVSDAANQMPFLQKMAKAGCAVSVVEQPPLDGSKVVLWAILLTGENITKEQSANNIVLHHNGYSHVFSTQIHSNKYQGNSREQSADIFSQYIGLLRKNTLSLKDNCMRTWLYVRDIDNNYSGMVEARNRIFDENDLTKDTHFIASTGIEGRYSVPSVKVLMDAYAVGGIDSRQVGFLSAVTHLNPTHEYGVAFERGTTIDYGDRRHIFISGTASIDNRGKILHPGDLAGQTGRVFENVAALLNCAGADLRHVASMIVYLRDMADYEFINKYMRQHYLSVPHTIVLAPVCRPGWLVEVECVAILPVKNQSFSNF